MLEYRKRLDREDSLLDKDLTADTDDLLADLDAAREERERQVCYQRFCRKEFQSKTFRQ
jgi:hypothetical protein